MQVILGSSSPARLQSLRLAGIDPLVVPPLVDESALLTSDVTRLAHQHGLADGVAFDNPVMQNANDGEYATNLLASAKGKDVLAQLAQSGRLADCSAQNPIVVLACDSMLELEGKVYGKPQTSENALQYWYRLRGRQGVLFTGHFVAVVKGENEITYQLRNAQSLVTFADLTKDEIMAYIASGEPQKVAGGFTINQLGGAFVTRIEGDPHNVIGISLPLVRQMLIDMNIYWYQLWRPKITYSG